MGKRSAVVELFLGDMGSMQRELRPSTQREDQLTMETKLEQIAVKAVNQLPKSVVREIRTPRSVGAGGGRPPPATRWMWKRSYRHGRRSRRADPSDPARRPCPPSRPFAWWGGGVRRCGTAAGSGAVRQVPRNSRYVHRERAPRLLGDAHPHIAADADQSRQRLPDGLPGPCKRDRPNRLGRRP